MPSVLCQRAVLQLAQNKLRGLKAPHTMQTCLCYTLLKSRAWHMQLILNSYRLGRAGMPIDPPETAGPARRAAGLKL